MKDDLLKRLETGHDKECAMSYGMHEHCCDCSYPARQETAARVRELEAERDALRALLHEHRDHRDVGDAEAFRQWHEDWCARRDAALGESK